jgi:hypothetical protein
LASTNDMTATAGVDYVAVAADTLIFPPLATQATLLVQVLGDLSDEPNETFRVRLHEAMGAALGDSSAIGTIVDDDVPTDVSATLPAANYLEGGAPNPFSGVATLRWGLRVSGPVELSVFDVKGRRLRRLVSGEKPAGHRVIVWDGRDENGLAVSNGLYLVRLRTQDQTFQRTIVRVR